VFNYENAYTIRKLQVYLLLYSGRTDSFTLANSRVRLNLPLLAVKCQLAAGQSASNGQDRRRTAVLAVTGISDQ